ncbi:organic cation transporter -like, partial [Brachionus plicatilis]
MPKSIHERTENLFTEVGEFGPYQFSVFILVGLVSVIPGIVGYSYSFYGATPNFRCKIPGYENDTYEIQNDYHQSLVDNYIPLLSDQSFKGIYDKCNIKSFPNKNNFSLDQCNEWVYSKQYFQTTLITEWNLVCQNLPKKNIFATLYFIGLYGVIISGVLSD